MDLVELTAERLKLALLEEFRLRLWLAWIAGKLWLALDIRLLLA